MPAPTPAQIKAAEEHPGWDHFRHAYCPAWTYGTPSTPLPLPENWFDMWQIYVSGWDSAREYYEPSDY